MTKTKTTKTTEKTLTIPCGYQGGKKRVATRIVNLMFQQTKIKADTQFYDLSCGGGAVTIELINKGVKPENITMVDNSGWGKFWESVSKGTFDMKRFKKIVGEMPKDPALIKDYVEHLSKRSASIDTAYMQLILQSASFGGKAIRIENGKWKTQGFRSFWKPTATSNRKSPVNPMMPMPNTLVERMEVICEKMKGVKVINGNVTDVKNFPKNSVVYINPPFKGKTGYGFDFDVKAYLNQLSTSDKVNGKFFVSESYKMTTSAYDITVRKNKGGISGDRLNPHSEWLNIF